MYCTRIKLHESCPQCGCIQNGIAARATGAVKQNCESFNFWHKFNQFDNENNYIGKYRKVIYKLCKIYHFETLVGLY